MTNIEKGIKLRSGKIVLKRGSYYDSDSDSEDGIPKPLLTNVSPPLRSYLSDSMNWERIEEDNERIYVTDLTESIEEKITSEISVPSGFGKVAGEYLEKLNRSYHDGWATYDQLYDLVKEFGKQLCWFPDDVPQKKVEKFCREAYNHTLWKTLLDEKIRDSQFVKLMGRKPKFFPKK